MKQRRVWLGLGIGLLLASGSQVFGAVQSAPVTPAAPTLTVSQAVELALNHSLRQKVAARDVDIARFKVEQAQAGYLPKVTLGGGVTVLNEVPDLVELGRKLAALNNAMDQWATGMANLLDSLGDPAAAGYRLLAQNLVTVMGPDDGLTYYGVKLRLEQPLYTGGKLSALNRQAAANLEYAEANLNVAEANLVYEVKKAYYTVLNAESIRDTLAEAVASMENHHREAELYYKAGMVSKLDVLRAEVKLADLAQKKITAENGVQLARSYLNFVMGMPLDTTYRLEPANLFDGSLQSLAESKQVAVASRSELVAARAKMKLANEALVIAGSADKPLVALFAEGEHKSTEFLEGEPDLSVGIVASFKLYDGGIVANQVNEARIVTEQAELGVQLTVQAIELEVEQTYRNLVNAKEAVTVSEKSLQQAEETVRMATVAYQAGLGTSLERIDAETGLTQAKNNHNQAIANYQIALAQYQKALGNSEEELK